MKFHLPRAIARPAARGFVVRGAITLAGANPPPPYHHNQKNHAIITIITIITIGTITITIVTGIMINGLYDGIIIGIMINGLYDGRQSYESKSEIANDYNGLYYNGLYDYKWFI